jgi:hypothetical protein
MTQATRIADLPAINTYGDLFSFVSDKNIILSIGAMSNSISGLRRLVIIADGAVVATQEHGTINIAIEVAGFVPKGSLVTIKGENTLATTGQGWGGVVVRPAIQLPPLHIKMYGVPSTPAQNQLQALTEAMGKAVLRDADGRAQISPPDQAEDIANKGYVDGVALGVGQTWQNVTASRVFNTTYTNTTGRAIAVSILGTGSPQSSTAIDFRVGSMQTMRMWIGVGGSPGDGQLSVFGIVPPGLTYSSYVQGTISLAGWYELR